MYFLDKIFSYFWPVIVVQCANVTHRISPSTCTPAVAI
jgi:hypothetical protein